MIKWSSFLKSFVLWLFTLLISCFTFWVDSSVSASYERDINVWGYNPYAQSYNLNITRNWTFLSEILWTTRPIFMLKSDSAFFWTVNWIPYFAGVLYDQSVEWFINAYWVCSDLDDLTTCSSHTVWTNTPTLFSNFLSSLTTSDYYRFEYVNNTPANGSYGWRTQCSYASLGICSQALSNCLLFTIGSDPFWISCSDCSCNNNYHSVLTGSWSINTYWPDLFSNIPTAFLSYPPSVGGNFDGSWVNNAVDSSYWTYTPITWNIVYVPGSVCTNWKAKNWYESNWMTVNSCYTYYSESNYITGLAWYDPWMSVDSLWRYTSTLRRSWNTGSFMEFDKWFSFWSYAYDTYKRWIHTWSELYTNVPNAIPWYFARIYGSSWSDKEYVDYCNIVLSDSSYLNSSYTWVNYNSVCWTTIWNWDWTVDEDWTTPWDSNNGGGSSGRPWWIDWWWFWWQTNNGGSSSSGSSSESWLNQLQDWTTFISNSYNELKKVYRIPDKSDFWLGILPWYIIWAFVWIIVFRFLSH